MEQCCECPSAVLTAPTSDTIEYVADNWMRWTRYLRYSRAGETLCFVCWGRHLVCHRCYWPMHFDLYDTEHFHTPFNYRLCRMCASHLAPQQYRTAPAA